MSVLFLYHTLSFFYESLSPFSSFSDRAFLSFRSFVVFHSSLPLLYTDINTRSLCGFPLSLNAGHLEKTAPPVCVSVWVQYVCVGYNFFGPVSFFWAADFLLSADERQMFLHYSPFLTFIQLWLFLLCSLFSFSVHSWGFPGLGMIQTTHFTLLFSVSVIFPESHQRFLIVFVSLTFKDSVSAAFVGVSQCL